MAKRACLTEMNSDFLTPPTNVNVKMLKLFKRALHNKIAQKGPKRGQKGPYVAQNGKRAQEGPRVSNRDE
jgi:hypothetical protein